jgi:hypothetical protein
MAENRTLFDEIIGEGFKDLQVLTQGIDNLAKSIANLYNVVEKNKVELIAEQEIKNLKKLNVARAESTKKLNDSIKVLDAAEKEQSKLNKAREDAARLTEAQGDSVNVLKAQLKAIKLEYNNLNASTEEGAKRQEELRKEAQKLDGAIKDQAKELRAQKKQIDATAGSYEALSKELAQARKEIKQLPNAFDEATGEINKSNKEAVKLAQRIQQLDKSLKSADESIGQFQRNVGDYKNQVSEALQESGLFTNVTGELGEKLETLKGLIIAATSGLKGQDEAQDQLNQSTARGTVILSRFGKALKASVIGLVIAAVAAVGSFFKTSEEGTLQFQKIIATVTAVINVLIESFAKLGSGIVKIFQATKEFAKGNVTKSLKLLDEATNDVTGAFDDFLGRIQRGIRLQNELVESTRDLEKLTRNLEVEIARLNKIYETQQQIVDDTTRSFAERENAARKAEAAQIEAAQKQVELETERLRLANLAIEAQGNLFDPALLDARKEATIALVQAEQELAVAILQNERQISELRQDRLERDLDFIIDVFDAQKTVNERLISNEKTIQATRRRLLQETTNLADQSFREQIDVIQELAGVEIDFNEILKLNNRESIERVRTLGLSEIIEGRVLEIIRERRTVLQDVLEAQRDIDTFERERLNRLENAENELLEFELERGVQRLQLNKQLLEQRGRDTLKAEQDILQAQIDLELFRRNVLLEEKNKELDELDRLEAEALKKATTDQLRFKIAQEFAEERVNLERTVAKERQLIIAESEAAITDLKREQVEKRNELTRRELDNLKNGALQLGEQLTQLSDVQSENRIQQLEAQNEAIKQAFDNQLQAAEGNEEAIDTINQQRAAKEQAIQRRIAQEKQKQARLDKAAGITQAIINTSQAVTRTLASLGVPLGLPFAAIAAATGAAEIATIAATEIPAFAEGVDSAPGGPAWVGEEGVEALIKDNKVSFTPDGPTLMNVERGTQILNAEETEKMFGPSDKAGTKQDLLLFDFTKELIAQSHKQLIEAVDNQRYYHFEVSEKGARAYMKNKQNRVELINERYK